MRILIESRDSPNERSRYEIKNASLPGEKHSEKNGMFDGMF